MSSNDQPRPANALDELRHIVPTEQIEPQGEGDRAHGGSWAVEPATRDELVDLMRWANERHAAVFTRNPRPIDPERCGIRPRIYLRGRRMSRVRDLDIVSGTLTVQSGIAMTKLDAILAERGWATGFPTRPWRQESLGSVLAAALDSHWGPGYGHMEEHVVSIGVVFPDGTVTTSRAAPRKAVGPDFDRLFLGSRGRFGIIDEVTLRIYPANARVVLSYGASDLTEALEVVEKVFEAGLQTRALEILTPAPDRSWGRKRVGLTDEAPVLVLVEPWGSEVGAAAVAVDELMNERLVRLEPPVGWNVHEGLLPAPREWTAPVVGVPWADMVDLATELGRDIPSGLWIVRMSRHGGWLSMADGISGASAERVRKLVARYAVGDSGPWTPLARALKRQLDPRDILNPLCEAAS